MTKFRLSFTCDELKVWLSRKIAPHIAEEYYTTFIMHHVDGEKFVTLKNEQLKILMGIECIRDRVTFLGAIRYAKEKLNIQN